MAHWQSRSMGQAQPASPHKKYGLTANTCGISIRSGSADQPLSGWLSRWGDELCLSIKGGLAFEKCWSNLSLLAFIGFFAI